MNDNVKKQPAGASDDDIILMSGLNVAEDRAVRAIYAKRAEQSKRERMVTAALWAMEHDRAVAFDSKKWPLDPDTDWPLSPRPRAMPETQTAYRVAVTMAKGRRTKRRKAAEMAAAEAFDITKIDLSGVAPFGSAQAMAMLEERRGQQAAETAMLW